MPLPGQPPDEFCTPPPLSRELLSLFDHLSDVYLFVKDHEHRFRFVNAAERAFHGGREMIGKRDEDFHPPVLARQYVDEDIRVMTTGRPILNQIWLVAGAGGRPEWYSCTKLPVRAADGRVIGIAGIRRPHGHAGTAPGEYARLIPAMEHVLAHYGEPVAVADLAGLCHLSVSQFQREFRRLFQMAPSEYLTEVRLQAARRALERTNLPLGVIALECGFYDQSYFVKRFKTATGLRPLEYRRRFNRSVGFGNS